MRQKARIENWKLVFSPDGGRDAVLIGHIYEHPNQRGLITEGKMQITSPAIWINREENRAVTLNTTYTLGAEYKES